MTTADTIIKAEDRCVLVSSDKKTLSVPSYVFKLFERYMRPNVTPPADVVISFKNGSVCGARVEKEIVA